MQGKKGKGSVDGEQKDGCRHGTTGFESLKRKDPPKLGSLSERVENAALECSTCCEEIARHRERKRHWEFRYNDWHETF